MTYVWNDPRASLPRRALAGRIRREIGPERDSWDLPSPVTGRGLAVYLLKPCGTEAAYRRHIRNGEKPCGACNQGNNRAKARRAA